LTIASLGFSFVSEYVKERERIHAVIADTLAGLNARSEQIEARITVAAQEEMSAEFDAERWANDGEIARRIGVA
jgi:hypothetical protein